MPAAYFVVRAIDALKQLVADFNRDWPEVERSRETLVQEFGT